jgi:hypothetical protein
MRRGSLCDSGDFDIITLQLGYPKASGGSAQKAQLAGREG